VFKDHGEITNVQLKYTPEGKFRKFAFVGFKTKESADAAIKALDKTFIEGSKLTVEVCARFGELKVP
jgi:multiple RNA-binding domain-containing protein 1